MVKLLDIVQMVTMNLSSEDSTLIIVMVLRTRWTKSIKLDKFTLILVCGWTIKESSAIQSLLVEVVVKILI